MTGLLPLRVHNKDGVLGLRDGLVFVLYIRAPHMEICESVSSLYQLYLKLVGEDSLQWIHDSGEYFKPFTKQKRKRVLTLLTSEMANKRPDELFTIKGDCDESEAAGHLFRYAGRDMKGRLASVNASFVEMWFPTEFPDSVGMSNFMAGLLQMAELVPFSSGYCSLAFNREDWAEMGTDELVRAKAKRHPGMDIHDTLLTAIRIGGGVRGAYWLTLLGESVLAELGMGTEEIKAQLGSKVAVKELSNGVAICCGEKPEPGDINRKDDLPLVRKVAELIQPVQYIQKQSMTGFSELDEYIAWQQRHLQ